METGRDRLAAARVLPACPACGEPVLETADRLRCGQCGRSYPIVEGIPDLRLKPDRFLSVEEDRAKGRRVVEASAGAGYEAALDAYWSMTPEEPAAAARSYLQRQRREAEIGRSVLAEIERVAGAMEGPLLDLGCGLGGLVEAAAARGRSAVGVDPAIRWLIVAQQRLQAAGSPAILVCGHAEAPPAAVEGGFSTVVLNDVLEHVEQPAELVRAAARAAAPGGVVYIASNNRFSAAPEPHVRLPAVGWLPAAWQAGCVRLLSGRDYSRVVLRSRGEVAAWVRVAGMRLVDEGSAPVPAPHLSPSMRAAARAFSRLGRLAPRFYVLAKPR